VIYCQATLDNQKWSSEQLDGATVLNATDQGYSRAVPVFLHELRL